MIFFILYLILEMNAFYQKEFIKSVTVNDAGLSEIMFRDNSRYLGQLNDQTIEGRGTLYIQDTAKLEGRFFGNQIIEGTFFFDSVFIFEGTFDENECLGNGILELTQTRDRIQLKCVEGKVFSVGLLDEEFEMNLGTTEPPTDFEHLLTSGVTLCLNVEKTCLSFKTVYNNQLAAGHLISLDLKQRVFFHHFYAAGHQDRVQRELYFSPLPYTKTYNLSRVDSNAQFFKMVSAKGQFFESSNGFDKGVTREPGKDYCFYGGVEDCHKKGEAMVAFTNDSCEMHVECIQDKICFDSLEHVFQFVKNFDCAKHPTLRFSESAAMVKFMEDLVYFEGKLMKGTSVGEVMMILKNDLTFRGKLVDFKMEGRGTVQSEKWEISGEFSRNELRYGVIAYKTGAKYEGQLLHYLRHEFGIMVFANSYVFQGNFLSDRISRKVLGKLIQPGGHESKCIGVDLGEFDLCVFVPQKDTEGLFVWNYLNDRIYDATFIDKLESSGVNIRESLRNIGIN